MLTEAHDRVQDESSRPGENVVRYNLAAWCGEGRARQPARTLIYAHIRYRLTWSGQSDPTDPILL